MKAGAALATGNVFILKPSEKTPFGPLALGSLIKDAGFPSDVFQIVSGDGNTGALLASHMKVAKINFTGSTVIGRTIQQSAAKSYMKRVTPEMGGKSPAIIVDDCDLANAVQWCVQGIANNSGQVCMAASKVYVQEGIYDKFVAAYKGGLEAATKTVGDPWEPTTMMGPIVYKIQFEKVSAFIERGMQQGKLLLGGQRIGDKVRALVSARRGSKRLTDLEPGLLHPTYHLRKHLEECRDL